MQNRLDVRGSVHRSTIHKEKSNKMQQCINIYSIPYLYEHTHTLQNKIKKFKSNKMQQYIKVLSFHIYTKINMFRATHRPSSGT